LKPSGEALNGGRSTGGLVLRSGFEFRLYLLTRVRFHRYLVNHPEPIFITVKTDR